MPLPYTKDSPKKHHHHHHRAFPSPTSSARTSLPLLLFALFSLAVGAIGVALAASALRRSPKTVSVFRCGKDEDRFRTFQATRDGGGAVARPKVLGVVGVLTGFGGAERRAALRRTWFPPDPEALTNLEHATGLVFRFVIGRSKDANKMGVFKREEENYHDFISIDVEEDYVELPYKTLAFLKAALNLFEAEFYVKMDDNVYLRPDRLATLLAKERSHPLAYIGCMKKGPVVSDPKKKWYESKSYLVGSEYFLHAYGPIYALSLEVVSTIAAAKNSSLRIFSNEDVTIGAWMLGMDVSHEDIEALCQTQCTQTSIAVWDMPKCSGLCNPVRKLEELHSIPMCSKSPTVPPEDVD